MVHYPLEDTIAAIATPIGEAGISVIRMSGPEAVGIAEKVFYPKRKKDVRHFASHTVHFGEMRNDQGATVDQVLFTFFRMPHSYTGEDVVEISSHGGIAVTRRLLDLLLANGARMAEPGEFTKRAFLNGKIDLPQAEAVQDLIKAKSERSMEIAMRQLEGGLSGKFRTLRDELMRIYAHAEAYLDFPEEDIEIFSDKTFSEKFKQLKDEFEKLIHSFERGSIFREGISCVILGKPNVGKSSLFNALLERDRAIVSEFPGTTRDHLEESIEIAGVYIRLSDTAGLFHEGTHPLEQIGMERTQRVLREAQLVLYMVDGSQTLEKRDREVFRAIGGDPSVLVLINKCDRKLRVEEDRLREIVGDKTIVRISAKTREGMDKLEARMGDLILSGKVHWEGAQITRLRHKKALEQSLESLTRAEQAFVQRKSLEFVVLDLKAALDALRELIGEVYSDDLLDVIFSEFCIGK